MAPLPDEGWPKRLERRWHYRLQLVWHTAVHALPGRRARARCTLGEPACARNSAVRGYRHHVRGRDTPACCRAHLLEVLDDVVLCLEPTGWRWFVFWGGFLGALRHRDLVPWDRDVDIVLVDVKPAEALALLAPLTAGDRPRALRTRGSPEPHLVRVDASEHNRIGVDLEFWHERAGVLVPSDPAIQVRPLLEEVFPLTSRALAGRNLPMPRTPSLLAALYGPDCLLRGVRVEQRFGRREVDLAKWADDRDRKPRAT